MKGDRTLVYLSIQRESNTLTKNIGFILMILVCVCMWEMDWTEWKDLWLETIIMLCLLSSHAFRGKHPKHSEYESEDLTIYQAIENAISYDRLCRYNFIIIRYYCQRFLKFLAMFLAGNCRNYVSHRMIIDTFRNISERFGKIHTTILRENRQYKESMKTFRCFCVTFSKKKNGL